MEDRPKERPQEALGEAGVPYEPPKLEVLGDLVDITQGTGTRNRRDAGGASV
jgi:hypothetical protein